MFEQHFGLDSNPFDGQAAGADVFVGPQTATLVNRAKRVFTGPESVICLSGPVGCGKTTLAYRALAAVGRPHTIIRIGRIRLGPDEVLDFLLRELGLKQMPAGTIQKMTVFRAVLKKLQDQGVRLFVVVEDAERLGPIALQELEALTATDSGVSNGANLVLMAEERLKSMLEAPALRRLRQRARLHFAVKPMTAPEVRGYLAHHFRRAGGDMAAIVADDTIAVTIHQLAEGIPRVINNLMHSALESAAENGLERLDTAELVRVAAEEYGLEADTVTPATATSATAAPAAETRESAAREQPAKPANDNRPPPPQEQAAAPDSEPEPEPETIESAEDDFEIPDLIQDTSPGMASPRAAAEVVNAPLPDIDALAATNAEPVDRDTDSASPADDADDFSIDDELDALSALTALADDDADAEDDEDIPTLFASSAGLEVPDTTEPADGPAADAAPGNHDEAVPAWDRDPTLAELRPDLDALERAMAIAHGGDDAAGRDEPDRDPVRSAAPDVPEVMPEITLDDSIRRKVDIPEATLLDPEPPGTGTENAKTAADDAPVSETISLVEDFDKTPAKADQSLERIAAELARAKSIEEVDDKLAETLFGEEFSLMAAEVAAMAAEPDPEPEAPEDVDKAPSLELALQENSDDADRPAEEVPQPDAGDPSAANDDLEREFEALYGATAVEVSMETTPTGLSVAKTETRKASAQRDGNGAQKTAPDPIEDQINTSITQTLKAFDPAKFADTHTEERSGFFSRFRRS